VLQRVYVADLETGRQKRKDSEQKPRGNRIYEKDKEKCKIE